MKVLIIDNNVMKESWGSADLKSYVLKDPKNYAFVRRGPHDDLPDSIRGFDRLILSGSLTSCFEKAPWISKLDDLIREAVEAGKPTLGVCFGHQSIVRAIGGTEYLGKSEVPEYGWTEVEVTDQSSALFEGLPNRFYSYSSHLEEVSKLPPGLKRLARSELCGIQAYEIVGKPVYGIQFHPEKDLASAKQSIQSKLASKNSKFVLNPTKSDALYDPKIGERIFGNFLKS